MIIREMTWDDIPAVVALDEENFDPVEQWTENGFLTHLLRDDTIYLVAEDDPAAAEREAEDDTDTAEEESGTLLGYAGMITSFSDGDITKLSVRKEYRRQGIGRALLCGMLKRASDMQVTDVFLDVRESNAGAIRLYESCGFEQIGVRRRYYLDPPEDALLMQYQAKPES